MTRGRYFNKMAAAKHAQNILIQINKDKNASQMAVPSLKSSSLQAHVTLALTSLTQTLDLSPASPTFAALQKSSAYPVTVPSALLTLTQTPKASVASPTLATLVKSSPLTAPALGVAPRLTQTPLASLAPLRPARTTRSSTLRGTVCQGVHP